MVLIKETVVVIRKERKKEKRPISIEAVSLLFLQHYKFVSRAKTL